MAGKKKSKRRKLPKLLKRTAEVLKSKGHDKESAYAIATATHQGSGSVKSGSHNLTKIGKARQKMGSKKRKAARKKGTVRQTTKVRRKQ